MAALFQIALNDFLMPLLWWGTVFVLTAASVSVAVIWWLVRRIRRLTAHGLRVSKVRVFLGGLTVCAASIVLPLSLALIHAVPFAVERGLAASIEKSAPVASDWLVDLSAGQMASLLRVSMEDTAIDVSALSARISTGLATLRTAGRPEPLFERLRWLSVTRSLGLLEKSVTELPSHVSWHDLVGTTKTLMRTQVSWLSRDVKTGLDAAATANVFLAVAWVLACNAAGVLILLLVVRGRVTSSCLDGRL